MNHSRNRMFSGSKKKHTMSAQKAASLFTFASLRFRSQQEEKALNSRPDPLSPPAPAFPPARGRGKPVDRGRPALARRGPRHFATRGEAHSRSGTRAAAGNLEAGSSDGAADWHLQPATVSRAWAATVFPAGEQHLASRVPSKVWCS